MVWEGGGDERHGDTANFLQSMARTLPPMLQVMKDIGGVEMPEYFGEAPADGPAAEPPAATAPPATDPPRLAR